jgi:hypothetical protein
VSRRCPDGDLRPVLPHGDRTAAAARPRGAADPARRDQGPGGGVPRINRRAGQGTAAERTHRFEDVLARTRFGSRGSSSSPASPICCETARASCPATSPCHPRRRICSAIGSTTSPERCGRCSPSVHPTASSGTGRATPGW